MAGEYLRDDGKGDTLALMRTASLRAIAPLLLLALSCGGSPAPATLPGSTLPVFPAPIARPAATLASAPATSASAASWPPSCGGASAEIARLEDADQAARKAMITAEQWPHVAEADLRRRVRISELFAEGCLKSADDFGSAALIFQHGDVPEHFLQTMLFASRAVGLGDASQKQLVALAADRYLMNTKHKQLFASQLLRMNDNPCWCMPQVEPTFPDAQRVAYVGKTLEKQRQVVKSMNAATPACTKVECDTPLQPTPKGTVPGLW
jgi:hypothetical protein